MKQDPFKGFEEPNTDPFDDWFLETHGGTNNEDEDADEVIEDDYSEEDFE